MFLNSNASLNIGHENIGTTFGNYAKINASRVEEIISSIDFSDSEEADDRELFEQFKALMRKKK